MEKFFGKSKDLNPKQADEKIRLLKEKKCYEDLEHTLLGEMLLIYCLGMCFSFRTGFEDGSFFNCKIIKSGSEKEIYILGDATELMASKETINKIKENKEKIIKEFEDLIDDIKVIAKNEYNKFHLCIVCNNREDSIKLDKIKYLYKMKNGLAITEETGPGFIDNIEDIKNIRCEGQE